MTKTLFCENERNSNFELPTYSKVTAEKWTNEIESGTRNLYREEYVMNIEEIQNIGKAIIERSYELLRERRDDWELGRYSRYQALEDAVKQICEI